MSFIHGVTVRWCGSVTERLRLGGAGELVPDIVGGGVFAMNLNFHFSFPPVLELEIMNKQNQQGDVPVEPFSQIPSRHFGHVNMNMAFQQGLQSIYSISLRFRIKSK